MTLRKAAQRALTAIDRALPHAPHCGEFDALADMADALRAALAEPVQEPATMPGPGLVMCPDCCAQFDPALNRVEPVQEPEPAGWFEGPFGEFRANPLHRIAWPAQTVAWSIPLYLAPPQRKPLTDDQITAINASLKIGTTTELVRAVERAHGIGGDGSGVA